LGLTQTGKTALRSVIISSGGKRQKPVSLRNYWKPDLAERVRDGKAPPNELLDSSMHIPTEKKR
jgi:hypothetical protein